jgi:c(7)-type cytochrome triheme protein
MKKAAKITQADHVAGKFCGKCHDGKKAFDQKECAKCHKK